MNSPIVRLTVLILFFGASGAGWAVSGGESNREEVHFTAYPEQLTGTFTGGFGEQSCHSCHFDYDLNPSGGKLKVLGIPDAVEAGQVYPIEVILVRENLGKAGFQLTARFVDGSQAGEFEIFEDARLTTTFSTPDSIDYIQHSEAGSEPVEKERNRWVINWKAPRVISDSIYFNIAANAANGDQSEFGDWIYVSELKTGF